MLLGCHNWFAIRWNKEYNQGVNFNMVDKKSRNRDAGRGVFLVRRGRF